VTGGEGSTEYCYPNPRSRPTILIGQALLANRSTKAVTLTRVRLRGVRALTLVDSWLIPFTGSSLGGGYPYPAVAAAFPSGYRWADRQRISDEPPLPPERTGLHSDLVVAVRAAAHSRGSYTGAVLTYTTGRKTQRLAMHGGFRFPARC
jgi:hypothetical protein